jgi:Stress responsive A/B Barrel Domain
MKFTDASDAEEAKKRLEELPADIPQIRTLHVGLDVVHSEVSFDLCLTTTHESVEELQGYQSHPVHVEFGGWLRPLLSARHVVDYES